MTRVTGSSHTASTAKTPNAKNELASLQKKIFNEVMGSGKAKEVKAPTQKQLAGAERLSCTPAGMVDAGATAYLIDGKMYAATSDFAGRTRWFECKATDAKKFETLKKDLYAASTQLPASKWSATGPRFMNGSDAINITPKGLMGVGTQAYVFGNEVWIARTPVTPNGKTQWAKL